MSAMLLVLAMPLAPWHDAPSLASVSGRVMSRETAVRGALVTARSLRSSIGEPALAAAPIGSLTDEFGQFRFERLDSGVYLFEAHKSGYLPSAFGALGESDSGTPVVVHPGSALSGLVISLVPGASLSGLIRDAQGPLSGIAVELEATPPARRVRTRAGADGRYRFSGLGSGEYRVRAVPEISASGTTPEAGSAAAPHHYRGYASVYFPGGAGRREADIVSVLAGHYRDQVDITLGPVPLVDVTGIVVNEVGARVRGATVRIAEVPPGGTQWSQVSPDGSFRFVGLPYGDYQVSALFPRASGSASLWSTERLPVVRDLLHPVRVVVRPTTTLAGRITVTGRSPDVWRGLRPVLRALPASEAFPPTPPVSAVAGSADGEFLLAGVAPGAYRLELEDVGLGFPAPGSARPWIEAVSIEGRTGDVFPLVVGPTGGSDRLLVSVAFRSAGIEGAILDPNSTPVTDVAVVVFPSDPGLWHQASPRVRLARPDTEGAFRFEQLPPGHYVTVALRGTVLKRWPPLGFPEEIVPSGVGVEVGTGEWSKVLLRVGR